MVADEGAGIPADKHIDGGGRFCQAGSGLGR